jgi:hypothetical protein
MGEAMKGSELSVAALIHHAGAVHLVRLGALPRRGELIELRLEGEAQGFEVAEVVHHVDTVHRGGWHTVSLFVQPSRSRFIPESNA